MAISWIWFLHGKSPNIKCWCSQNVTLCGVRWAVCECVCPCVNNKWDLVPLSLMASLFLCCYEGPLWTSLLTFLPLSSLHPSFPVIGPLNPTAPHPPTNLSSQSFSLSVCPLCDSSSVDLLLITAPLYPSLSFPPVPVSGVQLYFLPSVLSSFC